MISLILIIYGQSISYDYTVDDAIVISENMYVQEGISGIPGLWSHDTFQGFFKDPDTENLVSGGRYRPWTPTLFTIEQAIFGEKPWVGHLFSILTAIAAIALFMLVMKNLLTQRLGKKAAVYIASISGLIFAAHPVHTEVIANIKSRDELWVLLASFLVLLLMTLRKIPHILKSIGIALCAFIAMMSKENALFLLITLPLFYAWAYKLSWKQILTESLPICIAIGIALIIRLQVVGLLPGESSQELMNNPFLKWTGSKYIPFNLSERYGTAFSSLLTYLRLYLFPYPLTHDYYPRQIPTATLGNWRSLLSILLYSLITIGMILSYKKRRFVSISLFLFLFTLLPVSNLLFPIGTLASERFLFIPSLGLSLAIAYGIYYAPRHLRKLINYIIPFILIIFTILGFQRTQAWKNNFTLFSTDVKTSSASAKMNNAMAGALLDKAGEADNKEAQKKLAKKALKYADKAIEIHPTYKNAYLLRGNSYFYLHDWEKAIHNFNIALQLDPAFTDALNNKFICLRTAGRFYGEQKHNLRKSAILLKQALAIRPRDYETLRLMGVNQGIQRKHRQAIHYFKKALQVSKRKEHPGIIKNLGIAYAGLGMQDSSQYYLTLYKELKAQK